MLLRCLERLCQERKIQLYTKEIFPLRPPSTVAILPLAVLSSPCPDEDEDVALPEGIP